MGTGGIIFCSILALWAFYLVPLLVKERASRLESRADDATSPAVRVLQRPPAERLSHRVVLTVERPVVSDRMPARPTRDLATTLRRQARRSRLGMRLRGVAGLVGLMALVAGGGGAVLGATPWWLPAAAAGWLAGVVVTGAVTTTLRRRAGESVTRVPTLEPRARRVATEVFDGRLVRAGSARSAAATPVARTTGRDTADTADTAAMAGAGAAEDGSWLPVEVPQPVYVSKPASHRPPALPWSMPPVPAWTATGLGAAASDAETVSAEVPDESSAGPAEQSATAGADSADERHGATG